MGSIAPNSYGGEVKMSGTVVQHLANAMDHAKAIFGDGAYAPGDSGGQTWNSAKMGLANLVGDPTMKQHYDSYNSSVQSLSSELEKLLTNGRPTEGAIRERINSLDLSKGPQAVYNVLANVQDLMQGRLDNVAAAKSRAYGVNTNARDLLPSDAQTNYDKVLNNASSYNAQRSSETASPSTSGGHVEGATATNPQTGAKIVFRGGKWVQVTQ
jgi:hypothetical protein